MMHPCAVGTDDRISADQHADAARAALASFRDRSLYASSELQTGSVEALLAIHQRLCSVDERLRDMTIVPATLASDLELIQRLPAGPERDRLLRVAETELAARLRSRREVGRDIGAIIGGVLSLGGGVAMGVVALDYLHASWWSLLLACVLFVIGAFAFGDGIVVKRRDSDPKPELPADGE